MSKMSYENGKIYKIESSQGNKVYVGSTTKKYLSQRMDKHRDSYKQWKKGNEQGICTSSILFEEYGIENCQIILIENCPCNSKDEMRAREAFHIKSSEHCVNKVIPQRTPLEYYNENKGAMNAISRSYYANHKEEHKEYLERTKEHRHEQGNAYYHQHKDEYNKLRTTKITCECGCIVSKCNLTNHKKTAKHEIALSQNTTK